VQKGSCEVFLQLTSQHLKSLAFKTLLCRHDGSLQPKSSERFGHLISILYDIEKYIRHRYRFTFLVHKVLVKAKVVPVFNWVRSREGVLGKWEYSSIHI